MIINPTKILKLHRESQEVIRRGIEGMLSRAEQLGMFAPYLIHETTDEKEEVQAVRGGAWTTAEGLTALLGSSSLFSGVLSKPSQQLIGKATKELFSMLDEHHGKGVPPNPDIDITDRVVVDSTARVLLALVSLRRYIIRESHDDLPILPEYLPSLGEINNRISSVYSWLKENQNDDGGWGLWRDNLIDSRVDATSVVTRSLLDIGEPRNSISIRRANKWFVKTQHSNGGWGYYPNDHKPDPISTAYALMALSEIQPLSTVPIRRGISFLRGVSDWGDIELNIYVPRMGHGSPMIVPQLFPAFARVICSFVKCGESPFDPFIIELIENQINQELPSGGWAHKGSNTVETWYTYAVVDSFQIWNYYLQDTGILPRLIALSMTIPSLEKTIQISKIKNDQFQEDTNRLNQRLELSLKENEKNRKRNNLLFIALLISGIINSLLFWYLKKNWIAFLAFIPNLVIALSMGIITNALYDWLKNRFKRN